MNSVRSWRASIAAVLPVDCRNVYPTVDVNPGPTVIFLFVMNHGGVAGVQTAFEPAPSWTFAFGLWDCQLGPLSIVVPAPPFGPGPGTSIAWGGSAWVRAATLPAS